MRQSDQLAKAPSAILRAKLKFYLSRVTDTIETLWNRRPFSCSVLLLVIRSSNAADDAGKVVPYNWIRKERSNIWVLSSHCRCECTMTLSSFKKTIILTPLYCSTLYTNYIKDLIINSISITTSSLPLLCWTSVKSETFSLQSAF